MTHHVYVFWDGDEPLYVGVTGNLKARMKQHVRRVWAERATHVAVTPFTDQADAAAAEIRTIRALLPTYNKIANPRNSSAARGALDAADCDPAWIAAEDRRAAELVGQMLRPPRPPAPAVSPAEAGAALAAAAPPITDTQALEAARILAGSTDRAA